MCTVGCRPNWANWSVSSSHLFFFLGGGGHISTTTDWGLMLDERRLVTVRKERGSRNCLAVVQRQQWSMPNLQEGRRLPL